MLARFGDKKNVFFDCSVTMSESFIHNSMIAHFDIIFIFLSFSVVADSAKRSQARECPFE